MKHEKLPIIFPWIELIPFVLYAIAALYASTPTAFFHQYGLQFIQDIGAFAVPVAVIAGLVAACLGFIAFYRLRGWRRTTTLVLSIFNISVLAAAVCAAAIFLILLLIGKISH